MRELPADGEFTTAMAYLCGWSSSALKHAVRRGRVLRVRHGVYTTASVDRIVSVRAATMRYPRTVASDRSAILLHGLPLVGAPPPVPEITTAPRSNANLVRVHLFRATLRPEDVVTVSDVPTTSIARTLIDVARHRSTLTAVAALDAALHTDRVTLEELDEVLRFCWNWPRIRRAHRAVRLADGRAESPLESISRVVIGWLGLPPPVPQQWIYDGFGRIIARTDFYWDEFGVIGEADGRGKYTDSFVLDAEKDRQDDLGDLGLETARWGWTLATRNRLALRDRITRAFERGLARKRSGLPRKWTPGGPPQRPCARQT